MNEQYKTPLGKLVNFEKPVRGVFQQSNRKKILSRCVPLYTLLGRAIEVATVERRICRKIKTVRNLKERRVKYNIIYIYHRKEAEG